MNHAKDLTRRMLRVLHFNDVYHVGNHGGRTERAARFLAAAEPYLRGDPKPLVVCSGDILAPSLMSTITHGKHMMEVMQLIGVHVGTLGNHDFDFGVDRIVELTQEPCLLEDRQVCRTRWVMSNVDGIDGRPIAGCSRSELIDWGDVKVGVIGVCEDWLQDAGLSPSTTNPDKYAFWRSDVEATEELARDLKANGADVVLVLCHSMVHNTTPLVQITGVDFVLGGHEHVSLPENPAAEGWIISGWDFCEFSILDFELAPVKKSNGVASPNVSVTRVCVPPEQSLEDVKPFPQNLMQLRNLVKRYESDLGVLMEKTIGECKVALQAKKYMLRTQETNLGSMMADAFQQYFDADCALLIGGIISSHQVLPAGPIKMRHVLEWFPWEGTAVLIRLTGKQLLAALEHGVSGLPMREGRFPQVAGMRFCVDVSKQAGNRISDVQVAGMPLDFDYEYTVSTNDYVAEGGDGYVMLLGVPMIIDKECGPLIHDVARKYIEKLCAEGPIHPQVEGRIQHSTGFRIDANDAAIKCWVGEYGSGYDTHEEAIKNGYVG
mmetsp:Transcript_26756/g.39604  ORF Transcript_26756/g.39604 Transcript_26756/m.39604 type:complete len:548 (-) Transcript_26756:536-2179(-)|eukprot:CAMPEP_0195522412 /NCGR_PEP_ID=MMETSP0794_2-20130614/20574_1 /TAXON_ID=515487 /ORGANISM="Stephanopyxis turris, Strain CCMP 815" /LENGTH=547 /DNA_ID=CAMNT_0040652169 /DNA_START=48 /DNA_END=1691 /DNA_ORIENTATION=+